MIGVLQLFLLPRSQDSSGGRRRSASDTPVGRVRDRASSAPGTFGRIQLDDEPAILDRLRRGEHAAFETVFLAFYPNLAGYGASMVRDDVVGGDIAQDVLMRVWLNRATIKTQSLGAYLFAATRNAVLDYQRRGARERVRHDRWAADAGPSSPRPDTEGNDWPPSIADVELVIRELPARCQEVFRLKWQHGLKYGEIATLLGISVKTVDAQLVIATKTLRAAFKRPDV